MFLVYGGKEELNVDSYVEASFQTNRDDSRSQLDFVFLINGGAGTWRRSKQETILDSMTQSEYIATNEATKEVMCFKKLINDLVPNIYEPIEIFNDNKGKIALAKEP